MVSDTARSRALGHLIVIIASHSPEGVATGNLRNGAQEIDRCRIRAGNHLPGRAVPMLDQRFLISLPNIRAIFF